MMIKKDKINEIMKSFETKIAFFFGAFVFFIVFVLGAFNSVPLAIIMRRIIISESVFLPMGYMVGYILKLFTIPEKDRPETEPSGLTGINEEKKEELPLEIKPDVPAPTTEVKKEEPRVIIDNDVKTESTRTDMPVKKVNSDPTSELIVDAPLTSPQARTNPYNEIKKLGNLVNKDELGKFMIINDRKIVNEPEIMAKAVRTMLNKED
ncbi:MAG: hypothetical protein PHF84_01915 [bacterium]|nr:hypothetical protein [bacterium]